MPTDISLEKLVKTYIKMNAHLSELRKDYEDKERDLKDKMGKVKGALLDYCKEHDIDSVRTKEGLFYRTVKTNYWTSDWNSMRQFIIEHKVPELLHERLHQTNLKEFLEANPELLPPGLNVDSEYVVTVRRK